MRERKVTFQGPWADISRNVKTLIDDQWVQVYCEPDPDFLMTTVTLTKPFPTEKDEVLEIPEV
jgi:hypothetical protein